ncbi:hypothetical protein IT409_02930 [Candidatus Falkowbacteria bacterium]|nr:hypothetical protein [Candidatus Falkowbacteria bacterium]
MLQRLLIVSILTVSLIPTSFVSADPGPLDQYGGHECTHQCEEEYGLAYNQYHLHATPATPHHLLGSSTKPLMGFLSNPTKTELAFPASLLGHDATMIKNDALDVSLCMGATIFAHGIYDASGKVRVAPVCEAFTPQVLDYGYATLPKSEGVTQTKAYSFARDYQRRAYFTDMIPLTELNGMMIQGITDTAIYTVTSSDGKLMLRKISTTEKIDHMEQNKILLDDSVVYSYPIIK